MHHRRPGRSSELGELVGIEVWILQKELEWEAAGRLREDGTLRVDPDAPTARAGLSPAEVRSTLMILRPQLARKQKREAARLRGRKTTTWRRRFDRSGPTE